jgi:hypothetical protein
MSEAVRGTQASNVLKLNHLFLRLISFRPFAEAAIAPIEQNPKYPLDEQSEAT